MLVKVENLKFSPVQLIDGFRFAAPILRDRGFMQE
jgi:hypothetical protein